MVWKVERSKAYERLVKKLTIEILWIYVAKVIMSSGPLKAYEVKKKIAEKFNMKPQTMTTYTVIYRMTKEGLLTPTRINGDTVYSLTDKGKEEFIEAVKFLESILNTLKQ